MEPDFSGYATKAGITCSDGRTITADAFKHMDGMTVPLVWQHVHNDVKNVLGHGILRHVGDGMRIDGFLNDTDPGKHARQLLIHGDIEALSIYANQLVEKAKSVLHGMIKEVSLVISGANSGAKIDFIRVAHADGDIEELDDAAIIHTGLGIDIFVDEEDLEEEETVEHADGGDGPTVAEVYETMNDDQKRVVNFLVGEALDGADVEHSNLEDDENKELTHENKENEPVTRNIFEKQGELAHSAGPAAPSRPHLSHTQLKTIFDDAKKNGSLKEAVEGFLSTGEIKHDGVTYGIENIDFLFPDAQALSSTPQLVSRKMEWVEPFLNGVSKSRFSRVKTLSADITHDEARAKGYVKATMKKDEFFAIAKRITTPQTIYKKQKLDRDDIVDITDFDVVAWLKAEMLVMLKEELARAILVGDGREVDDPDKIQEDKIRPIAYDDDFYNEKVVVAANTSGEALVEAILRARPKYRGAGQPTLFMTEDLLTDLLLIKDGLRRRMYSNVGDLAVAMRVRDIVTVPVMEDLTNDGGDILAVLVNLSDYTVGADRGGETSFFDDFDIDFNQFKYLYETRVSGALTSYKSAITFSRSAGTLVTTVTAPTFNTGTGVVTLPTVTGVVWKQDGVTKSPGAQTAVAAGVTTEIVAEPAAGYYFRHNLDTDWEFTRNA